MSSTRTVSPPAISSSSNSSYPSLLQDLPLFSRTTTRSWSEYTWKNCYRTVYCDLRSFSYLSSSPNFLGVFLKIYFALCTLFECLTFVSIFLCLPLSGILHFIKQIRVHKKGLIVLAMRDRGSPLASGPPVLRTSSDFHGRHANNKLFYRV